MTIMRTLTLSISVATLLGGICSAQEKGGPAAKKAETPAEKRAIAPALDTSGDAFQIKNVPFVRQMRNFAGEACVEMVLSKMGKNISQEQVFNASGVDPTLGRGCNVAELDRAMRALGFVSPYVGATIDPGRIVQELSYEFNKMLSDLRNGIPAIVHMRKDNKPGSGQHYRLILGYSPLKDQVIFHDPSTVRGEYLRMGKKEFFSLWALPGGPKAMTLVRFRMHTDMVKEPPLALTFTNADFAQHLMIHKRRLPKGFNVVLQPPFVVISNIDKSELTKYARGTIKWSTEQLKKTYFPNDPSSIVNIWLFDSKDSYEKYTPALFRREVPPTNSYYLGDRRAIGVNMVSGKTLVTGEIVKPLIEANFPNCPAWLKGGMAAMYAQSGERNGEIRAFTNWRLPSLKRAIARKRLPSLSKLVVMSDSDFVDDMNGTNEAHAGYLCYFLQQKHILKEFYDTLVKNAESDPTGEKTLLKVSGAKSMEEVQKAWEAYTLRLIVK